MSGAPCQYTNKVSGEDENAGNQRIVNRYRLLETARRLAPGRTKSCLQTMIRPDRELVQIHKRKDTGKVSLRGVMACGSVWGCPCCAPKIGARRADEVTRAAKAAQEQGLSVYMAALTIPHDRFQDGKALREGVAMAFKKLQQGRAWKTMKDGHQMAGMIRSLEVTHGQNGWHPHLHLLVMFEPGVGEAQAETFGRQFYGRWIDVVKKAGFGTPSRDLWKFERCRKVSDAAGYVAKWAMELTLGSLKKSKNGNRSPWELLRDAEAGDDVAAMLFRRYAEDFRGARQLTWSQGLKKRFLDDEDVTDEDAANADEPETENVITIHRGAWVQIAWRGLISTVMIAAEKGGREAVEIILRTYGIENIPEFKPPVDLRQPTEGWENHGND